MTHTLAVGPELAHTEFQINALLNYLEQLLKPGRRPAEE